MNESLEGTSHNGTTWANMGKMITPVAWAWPDRHCRAIGDRQVSPGPANRCLFPAR